MSSGCDLTGSDGCKGAGARKAAPAPQPGHTGGAFQRLASAHFTDRETEAREETLLAKTLTQALHPGVLCLGPTWHQQPPSATCTCRIPARTAALTVIHANPWEIPRAPFSSWSHGRVGEEGWPGGRREVGKPVPCTEVVRVATKQSPDDPVHSCSAWALSQRSLLSPGGTGGSRDLTISGRL